MNGERESGPRFVSVGGSGAALQLVPPFDFEGVTMRTFPLRASLPKLTKFVDSYLNIIPREVGYFRPFLPYVYLMVINYGKMAVEAANMGWIAQNEIAFSIGLEWYKERNGQLEFHDFAYVSPFIYVDNDLSMTTGREVYGWPKSLVSITPETTSWMENPRKGPRLATISAMVFPELYTGARQELRPFLQVEHSPVPSLTQVPPDLSSALLPWNAIPKAIRGAGAMLGDLGGILNGLGITRAQPGATPKSFGEMARLLAGNLNPYRPNIYFNTVNLKQFRDSGVQGAFCYQAVTNARMCLTKFNAGGMLGDLAMMLGDPSGGYRILLHEWPTQPVRDSLGLEVTREWAGDGTNVAELSPVCPLWLDVDMQYARGRSLAWRTRGRTWAIPKREVGSQDPQHGAKEAAAQGAVMKDVPLSLKDGAVKIPLGGVAKEAARAAKASPEEPCSYTGGGPCTTPSRYNTALGTSLDLTGPFDFPSTTLRVLPLPADRDKLQAFCDGYLNEELKSAGHEFVRWGRYVYLVATSYEEMASESNNVGSWADNDVVFYVPVKWYYNVDGKRHLRTVALLPVFAFADGTTVAITRSEVTGIPTQKAEIESPPDNWMEDAGPSNGAAHHVLNLRAQVLPVLGMGQPTSERTLIEISEQEDVLPYNDDVRWRFVAEGWGKALLEELRATRRVRETRHDELADSKALGAALLTGQLPIHVVTLKQFRDAEHPETACYQSIAEVDRTIERVYDLREIEERMIVRIQRYESRPIVESLGLIPKWTDFSGAAPVDAFQAMRPFWMKVAMREDLASRVLWRAGQTRWEEDPKHEPEKSVFATDPAFHSVVDVGGGLVDYIEHQRPQRLRDRVTEWKARPGMERITAARAVRAIEAMGPQPAIESILSNEWEHWGNPHWWGAYQELERRLRAATADVTGKRIQEQELRVANESFRDLQDILVPGRQDILDEVAGMLKMGAFVYSCLELTSKFYEAMEKLRAQKDKTDREMVVECATTFAAFEARRPELEKAFRAPLALNTDPRSARNTNPFAPVVEIARKRWETGKEEIMVRLAKVAQPPETFVRRDCLGTETERRMPSEHGRGRDRIWYIGPDAPVVMPNPSPLSTVFSEGVAVKAGPAAEAMGGSLTAFGKTPPSPAAAAPARDAGAAAHAVAPAMAAPGAPPGSQSKSTSRARPPASKKGTG